MASEADQPAIRPAKMLWDTITAAPGIGKVLVLAGLAGLTESFGIVMLVPIMTILGNYAAPGSGPLAWLPAAPLWSLLLFMLLLIGIRLVLQRTSTIAQARLEYAVTDQLRSAIHSGLLAADWRWLAAQRKADFVNMLVSQIGRIGHGLGQAITLFVQLLKILAYGAAVLLLSWQTTLAAALLGGAFLLIFYRQRRRSLIHGQTIGPLNRDMHRTLQESITEIRMNKVIGLEQTETAALDAAVDALRQAQQTYLADATRGHAWGQAASAVLVAALIWFGIEIADIGIPVLLPLLLVVVRLLPMLEAVFGCWQKWLHAAPALDAANTLLATLRQYAEPDLPTDSAHLRLHKELRLAGVAVRFESREEWALQGIDLVIPARTTTILSGPSGAGKSTLADVLTGLIAPDSGTLTIDGVAVQGADRLRWRKSVSYVDQNAAFRNGTIRSNLTAVLPSADEQALEHALKAASADFVWDLPQGLDTQIGDNGVQLSGGERQRIALARGLLGNPQLLILDEATNALDPHNKAVIAAALGNLRGSMTILIISHGTVPKGSADRLIRLERGRLAALPADA